MQADTPLVSIITPVYNAERYIARCVESVRAQTFANWEQLIVDDGSTDATANVVARFGDARIRYFKLPHRGLTHLAETYNHALAHARGALVAVLEGDDFWPTHKLTEQVQVFEEPDVMLSWGRAVTVDEAGHHLGWWRQPSQGTPAGRMPLATLFKLLTRKNPLTPAATVMVRRAALESIGGFHQPAGTLFVDLPTWLQLAARVDGSAIYLRRCLACYRVHQQQTSHQRNSQMRYQHLDIVNATLRQLPREVLLKLRWSISDEHAALASASLTRGVAALNARERKAAYQHFRTAFGRSRITREKLGAILGMVSAASRINLFSAAEQLETRLRGEKVHAL